MPDVGLAAGERAPRAPSDCTYSVNASTGSLVGPAPDQTTNQERSGRPPRGRIDSSRPRSSSSWTATRDWSATPSPMRAAFLIAPLEPSVSSDGWSCWAAR